MTTETDTGKRAGNDTAPGELTLTGKANDMAAIIAAAAVAAGKDNGRPVLAAIELSATDTGAMAVATDSYRLAVVESGRVISGTGSALLPAKELGAAVTGMTKALGKAASTTATAILTVAGNGWTLDYPGATVTGYTVQGTYPAWRELIPQDLAISTEPAKWNTLFLADMAKILKAIGGDTKTGGATLVSSHPTRPSLWEIISGDGVAVRYLLMPLRG